MTHAIPVAKGGKKKGQARERGRRKKTGSNEGVILLKPKGFDHLRLRKPVWEGFQFTLSGKKL